MKNTTAKNVNTTEDFDFEKAMVRLQTLSDELESGKLSLEDSIGGFEEGMKLVKQCRKALEQAEARIVKLVRDEEEWHGRPSA